MVDLTQVIVALLTLAISVVSAFLIPYIKSKVSAEQLDAIKFWVNISAAINRCAINKCEHIFCNENIK